MNVERRVTRRSTSEFSANNNATAIPVEDVLLPIAPKKLSEVNMDLSLKQKEKEVVYNNGAIPSAVEKDRDDDVSKEDGVDIDEEEDDSNPNGVLLEEEEEEDNPPATKIPKLDSKREA